MYDIAIIGAGVVGGMVARALSAYEISTVILEKENDVAMGATKANSAIVHAGFDAKEGSLKAKLNVFVMRILCILQELRLHFRYSQVLLLPIGNLLFQILLRIKPLPPLVKMPSVIA